MILLDVQHIKNLQNPLSRNAGWSLKGYPLHSWKGRIRGHHGESGSGKSTLLNIPHAGSADRRAGLPQWHRYLNHQEQGRLQLPPGKTRFVFQDFNLLDTLSVKDNILLPLVLSRRPVKEMMSKVDSVSRELGIHQLLEKYLTKSLVGKSNG